MSMVWLNAMPFSSPIGKNNGKVETYQWLDKNFDGAYRKLVDHLSGHGHGHGHGHGGAYRELVDHLGGHALVDVVQPE